MIPQLPSRSVLSRRQVLASAVASMLASAGSAQAQGEKNGSIIVWPELKLLSGATLRTDDWSNMSAVIVFWETWCPYCKRQNAHVDQLYQATLRQKMRVIGVTTEKNEAKVRAYMQSNQFSFPVALIDTESGSIEVIHVGEPGEKVFKEKVEEDEGVSKFIQELPKQE